jgi:lipopolysaccharide transport system permease protein
LQLGLFISPVGFSSAIVPSDLKVLYSLNPMASIIDGFRWSILPHSAPLSLADLGVSCLVIALVLWSGVRYFLHAEASFADVV